MQTPVVLCAAMTLMTVLPALAQPATIDESSPHASMVATVPPVSPPALPVASWLAVAGAPVTVAPGLSVRLLRVIRPDAPESVGNGRFTEYVFELRNLGAERELRLSQPALTVAGTVRRPPASPMAILRPEEAVARVQRQADGLSLLNLLGSFLPGAGALVAAQAGAVGAVVAQSAWQRDLVANPQVWLAELQRRSFGNQVNGEVLILPGETTQGSLWIRQDTAERATRLQAFVRAGEGGEAQLASLELRDNANDGAAPPAAPVPTTE